MIEDYLEIQLAHSESNADTGCPVYVPQLGVEQLHKFAEQAAKHSEQIGKLGRYALSCLRSNSAILCFCTLNETDVKTPADFIGLVQCLKIPQLDGVFVLQAGTPTLTRCTT